MPALKRKLSNRKSFILAVVLAIAVFITVLGLTNTTHMFHKERLAENNNLTSTSQEPTGTTASSTNGSQGQPASVTNTKAGAGASTALQTPTGTFVSNHHPSLSGSALSRRENSVCNAAVNASCYIVFSKDGITKKLPAQTIDSSGSTYWTWDVSQMGLTQGSWAVSAVASLNDQSLTGQDSSLLEVQP